MKVSRYVETKEKRLVSVMCDKCKKVYSVEDDEIDCRLELQEFHHIHFTGGYSSVFGDETTVECDLCQHCLHDMIKDCMVTTSVYYGDLKTEQGSNRRKYQAAMNPEGSKPPPEPS